jgi:hypothetical protein
MFLFGGRMGSNVGTDLKSIVIENDKDDDEAVNQVTKLTGNPGDYS